MKILTSYADSSLFHVLNVEVIRHDLCVCSVTAVEAHLYTVGDEIMMRLMKKGRGDVRVAPRQHWLPSDGLPCSLIG